MNEYISTFTTGFGEVINRMLPMSLKGVSIISVYDGLIHYQYSGDPSNIVAISYLNNSYYVIKVYKGSFLDFSNMARNIKNKPMRFFRNKGSFRIRFSRENHFEKVNNQVVVGLERFISKNTGMRVDRVNPENEFWFIIRSENIGFFGQLLRKRQFTEKNLSKGELRPEFAFLMVAYADILPKDTVCDPFAGHGAIPIQLVKLGFQNILVNDLNLECYNLLKNNKVFDYNTIRIINEDALVLQSVISKSIDVIVTDPPWGYYERILNIQLFYEKMLRSFRRVLKTEGKAIVLTARKDELVNATQNECVTIAGRIDTLVNGKKVGLFTLKF